MIVSKITRKILHHIYTIILSLSYYPQERIDAFCIGHNDYLNKAPITPANQILIDNLATVFNPYDTGITVKHSDKGKRATDVTKIKEYKPSLIVQLNDITNQINTITHSDKNILKELNLNKQSLFYDGKESEILRYHKELLFNVKLNPAFVTVLPAVEALVTAVNGLYGVKTSKKVDIKSDITAMDTYVDPLAKVLLTNFLSLNIQNINNLDAVVDYFPYIYMDESVKADTFLYKNQWIIDLLAGEIKNDIRLVFKFKNWLKIQNLSLGDCMVFLSDVPNPTVIPGRAVRSIAGETIEFPFENIGSATELYLIFAAVTPGVAVKLKVTVKDKK